MSHVFMDYLHLKEWTDEIVTIQNKEYVDS